MHGQNPILSQDLRKDSLQVEDVFYTIQGEGPFAGRPAVFVRFSACWLRCHWCDTQFMSGIHTDFTARDVFTRIYDVVPLLSRRTQPSLIVLTGGDPLRQNIVPLCELLTCMHTLRSGSSFPVQVQIETAGLAWVPGLEFLHDVSIVVSPKTGKVAPQISRYATAWKYIIDADDEIDANDGLPNSSTQVPGAHQRLARPPDGLGLDRIYIQPCDREDVDKNRRNVELVTQLALQHGYRVSLQTHKLLGVA